MMEMNLRMQDQVIELTKGKSKEDDRIEEVKSTVTLPKLEPAKDDEAAVICGDWLTRTQTAIGSMTKNSKTWWNGVVEDVKISYQEYLAANPILRLDIWPVTKNEPRWEQLEEKVSHLLLESLVDQSLVSDILASRKVDPRSILFKVMVAYQPG